MSDEAQDEPTTTPDNTPPNPPQPPSADTDQSRQIRAEVADMIGGSGPTIRAQVIANLFEKEKDRRVDLLMKGLKAVEEAEHAFYKVKKPDVVVLGEDGKTIVSSGFTAERIKARKEAQDNLDKANAKLNAALVKGDYSKL